MGGGEEGVIGGGEREKGRESEGGMDEWMDGGGR